MPVFTCLTCGAQYEGAQAPLACRICNDDRQYVGENGCGIQKWASPADLLAAGHVNTLTDAGPGLYMVGVSPPLAIGQVAHLLIRPEGNILWDCLYLAEASIPQIRALGGVTKVVISHPHFYTAAASWAAAFGCQVYAHAVDAKWVTHSFDLLRQWTGDELSLAPGLHVHKLGGHFPGSCVMLWTEPPCASEGILFTGDTVMPTPRGATFMYSYPNMLPLPAGQVARMRDALHGMKFAQVRGSFEHKCIMHDARQRVLDAAELYIGLLDGTVARRYF